MASTKNCLQSVIYELDLKNAAGDPILNGAPGIMFWPEFVEITPTMKGKYYMRYLSPEENPKYAIAVTAQIPGGLGIILNAAIETPFGPQNKVTVREDTNFINVPNFQSPKIIVK